MSDRYLRQRIAAVRNGALSRYFKLGIAAPLSFLVCACASVPGAKASPPSKAGSASSESQDVDPGTRFVREQCLDGSPAPLKGADWFAVTGGGELMRLCPAAILAFYQHDGIALKVSGDPVSAILRSDDGKYNFAFCKGDGPCAIMAGLMRTTQ